MVKKLSFFLMLTSSVAFGVENLKFENTYRLWELSKNNSEYTEHLIVITEYNNKHAMDHKGGCYSEDGGSVELILTHDKNGFVVASASKYVNRKSDCFINLYLGKQFPSPPYAPYYERVILR